MRMVLELGIQCDDSNTPERIRPLHLDENRGPAVATPIDGYLNGNLARHDETATFDLQIGIPKAPAKTA